MSQITISDLQFPNLLTAVITGRVHVAQTPLEITVTCGNIRIPATILPREPQAGSAAARLLDSTHLDFEAELQLPQPVVPGQSFSVAVLSGSRRLLAQETFAWPEAKRWNESCIKLSRAHLVGFGSVLHVNGWLSDPNNISRIELRSGRRCQLAHLHVPRLDVVRNNPRVGTEYNGFEVQLADFKPRIGAELAVFDRNGRAILRRRISPAPQDIFIRRHSASQDIVVASHDASSGLLAVTAAIRGLEPPLRFHIKGTNGLWLSVDASLTEEGRAPKALTANNATWIGTAVFDTGDLPFDEMELLVEDHKGAIDFKAIARFLQETPARRRITSANYCSETHNLVVQGACGFLGTSHVHAMLNGQPVSASRTFLKNDSSFLTSPDTGFYLASLIDLEPGGQIEMEFFAGQTSLGRQTARIGRKTLSKSHAVGTSCRSSQGGAHYRFASALERPDAPWILYATGMASWPVTGGGMARSYAMAKYLRRQGYRVALIVDYPDPPTDASARELRDFADAVVFLPRTALASDTASDFKMFSRNTSALGPFLETLEAGYNPRATIVNFAFNLYSTEGLRGPVILDAHDVQHLRARNAQLQGAMLEDRRCTRLEEINVLKNADAIIAIQPQEQNILQDCAPGLTVVTAEHALEVQEDTALPSAEQLRHLLFVGQRYTPNIDGLQAFLDTAWPAIRKRHPDVHLHVAGRVCEVFKDIDDSNMTLHGVVPRLEQLYSRCGIVINPTGFGTGFKIKSLEGLAHRRCVVTTQSGTLGLPPEAPLKISELSGFADVICSLIDNPTEAITLAGRGADFVRARFAPDRVYRPVVDLIESLGAAPEAVKDRAEVVRHEVLGPDLVLTLRFAGSAGSGARRFIRIEARTAIGPPLEIWHSAPGDMVEGRFKLPIPVWHFDGTPFEIDLRINDQPIAPLTVTCPMSKTEAYMMPNWYFGGLGSQTGIGLAAARTVPAAPADAIGTYTLFSRNQRVGLAVGKPRAPWETNADWVKSLAFLPASVPTRTTDTLSIYDCDGQTLTAVLSAQEVHRAIPAAPGRAAGSGRAPRGVWLPDWPVAADRMELAVAPRGNRLASQWARVENGTEERFTLLLKSGKAISGATLEFPGGTDEDNVFRWHIMADGKPVHRKRKIVNTARAITLQASSDRQLDPGVHVIDLIRTFAASDAPDTPATLPQKLVLLMQSAQ